jgi:hypothetical protein
MYRRANASVPIVHAFDVIDDPDGAVLPDDASATAEAVKIIRELKSDYRGDQMNCCHH